ncbi:hypothetical protein [Bosea sp. (in: a-proteobacteria)]|uniref:hypothetical protein n=1 Tax=Bosea sp. (in: a-proteobacteria) TaxID=1871050 RepID=UPI0025BA7A78|nr:hypothetical protein [Bosea sp. (in: a-proteobacteria)]
MKIEPATARDVWQVAVKMRSADYEEFSAVSFSRSRAELAEDLAARYGDRHDVLVAYRGETPACIGGFIMARPNVVTLLFFATDEFPHIGLGITRFIRQNLFPKLEQEGVHRFEAVSLATHSEAHKWLGVLGLTAETGPMLDYGRDGEAFIQFAKVRDVQDHR